MTARPTVEFAARGYDDPDVATMVAEVQAEYVVRYGGPDEAAVDPTEFAPPNGMLLVASVDGVPAATGGWRVVARAADGTTVAEIKRMYVRAAMRNRGLARAMLAELERTAAAAGVRRLVLNTGPQQPEAIALYESSGYLVSAPFGHYADHPGALFYERDLT